MADFEIALPITLKHEGGYSDDPADPGGATNLGVTKATWEAWAGRTVEKSVIEALTVADVKPLYKARYWDVLKLDDEEDQAVANSLFDFFVNVSPKTFHQVIIAAAPVTADSLFREKVRHYVAECWRRRHSGMKPADADKFLLNWIGRAAEMI